LSSAKAVEFI
jgi:transposase InsO family protein